MREINWAIVGPGGIAADFSKALNEVNGTIYGVWARNLQKAEAFAEKFSIQHVYKEANDLFQDENIDVVYIATPHSIHYGYIMEALENGKHVLCEKAITMNSKQLHDIVTLAKEKELIVAEAMTLYHMPLYKELRQIVASGRIGTVKMVHVTFGSCKEDDPSNRFFNPDLAGGAILDIGTYALSFTRFFLSSQPNEIVTTVKKYETGVDEQSGIVLKNDKDELAVIALAMRAKLPKRGIVTGDLGFITVDNFPRAQEATITNTLDGSVEVIKGGDTEKALHYEVEAMNSLIQNKEENWTLPLSIQVMTIMDEVRRQWGLTYECE